MKLTHNQLAVSAAALVIAGLAAQGTTTLGNIQYIERGYEDLVGKLRGVGADIEIVDLPDPDTSDNSDKKPSQIS